VDEWQSGFQTKRYVADPQELFGYNEPGGMLDQLYLTLNGGTSIQILGERNAGKTSVLRCIETRFLDTRPQQLPVYLEFHSTDVHNPIDAYRHIVANIHATFLVHANTPEELTYGRLRMSADRAAGVHYRALQTLDESEMLSAVEGYFRQLSERGFGVLLLFDEYEYLMREVLQGQAAKFWDLRNVATIPRQHGSPHSLTIVLAGGLEWSDFCRRYGSPALGIVNALRILSPLSRQAFGKMWMRCREDSGTEARRRLESPQVRIDKVYDLAGGWAYAGKMIGQHVIACNRLDEVQLASDFRPHFEVLWKQRAEAEHEQLLAVARGDVVPLDAVHGLEERGLVEDDGRGRAGLRGILWRRWVEAQLASSSSPPLLEALPPNLFRREGKCFQVRYACGKPHPFPATDGFHYIAHLLSRPPEPAIAALELEKAAPKSNRPRPSIEDDDSPTGGGLPAYEAADEQALRAYWARLQEIRSDLDEVDRDGEDYPGQKDALQNERSQILNEIQKDTGHRTDYLGQCEKDAKTPRRRQRKYPSDEFKASERIRKALDKAYEIIGKEFPDLASHLHDSIKAETGTFAYQPVPPVEWHF